MMDNMNYIKFRCDLDEDEPPYPVVYRLFKERLAVGIMGVETMNAYGEIIKRHLHYHFITNEKIETIRKRYVRSYGDDARPNYSLKLETDVKDPDRFFRYPLKQYIPDKFLYSFRDRIDIPEGFDVVLQNKLAYEEWNKGKQILTAKAVKNDSRLTVYERIIDKIEKEQKVFCDVNDIKFYILDYFMEEKLPPNKQKIVDMANGIAIAKKIISREEFFR